MSGKHKTRTVFLIILLVFSVLLCLLASFLLINRFHVAIELHGEPALRVECKQAFTDPGAQASLRGSLLFSDGHALDVHTQGQVDTAKPGQYTLTYSARFLWYQASVERTVTVADTTAPTIELKQDEKSFTLPGQSYVEEGFTAIDSVDGDLTEQVRREEKDGKVYYSVSDSSGNKAEAVREIRYNDPTPPVIELKGEQTLTLRAGSAYDEPGYSATDNCDGDLTDKVTVEGKVDIYRAGDYTLTYRVSDSFQNTAEASRKVTVLPASQPQTVTPNGKNIYLTFDDGPGPYTQELLDVLAKYNVKATFFVVNTGYTELIAKEAAAGHSIGVHSATHDYDEIYASEDAYFADFERMESIIERQTGKRTTLLRFPGGSSNTVSNFNPGIMTRLTKAVTDLGYQYFDWNVSSGDAGETTDTDQVVKNVISGVQDYRNSVVLQHDIKHFSVAAVERIIVWGLENGYTFLPLSADSPKAHHGINN